MDRSQAGNFVVYFFELGLRSLANIRTIRCWIGPQREQRVDLLEGKPKVLSLANEPDALRRLLRIAAKAAV